MYSKTKNREGVSDLNMDLNDTKTQTMLGKRHMSYDNFCQVFLQ